MTSRTSYVTVTDQFCGAGGSSIGAVASGAVVRMAMNHDIQSLATHQANFPQTDHDCTDISACDPYRYPATDVLITSPECTNHSLAKGKRRQIQHDMFHPTPLDPVAERSRATMWDVCRFAEAHQYRIVIVENVVEARWWPLFDVWLQAMKVLGYCYEIVYMNSMFAPPTPQSRDRMYVVFWQRTLRTPNVQITPPAYCPQCGQDCESVQSWKQPTKRWGRYRKQYVYRCPTCSTEVTPYYFCAANAIDWSIPAPRIGDRAKPLKPKTRARIQAGLTKYATPAAETANTVTNHVPPYLIDTAYPHGHHQRTYPLHEPGPTQTTQQTHGLVLPPLLVGNYTPGWCRPVTEPCGTVTTTDHHALIMPPFIVELRKNQMTRHLTDPLGTICAGGGHHGVCMPFVSSYYGTEQSSSVTDALPTIPTRDRHGVVVPTGEAPSVDQCSFRMLQPHEIGKAMAFPTDYIVLGNKREQVKQYGNAVTPPVMHLLLTRCLEVLG